MSVSIVPQNSMSNESHYLHVIVIRSARSHFLLLLSPVSRTLLQCISIYIRFYFRSRYSPHVHLCISLSKRKTNGILMIRTIILIVSTGYVCAIKRPFISFHFIPLFGSTTAKDEYIFNFNYHKLAVYLNFYIRQRKWKSME